MWYIILKGLFEPDSVAHFAGSLICIVLCSMIIYVVLYDLANNFKTHCKSVINEVGNALFNVCYIGGGLSYHIRINDHLYLHPNYCTDNYLWYIRLILCERR